MNKLIGIAGTAVGGGLIGAGIQRTHLVGNRISSGLSKMLGKGGFRFDNTTWAFLIAGALLLLGGVFYLNKRR